MIFASNLTKTFGTTVALDNIDLNIGKGQVFGLIGSNGSGKSTLLRILSGVYIADSGKALIEDQEILDNPALKSKIFFLSDTPYYFANATLKEMVEFYSKMYKNFSYERLNELSKIFPIDHKTKMNNMSKGMMRQASIMLAFASCPDYLFLDEAFDGLDPVMRESLKRLITKDIIDRDLTVIITSHNLRELEDMCDRVGLLHNGKIIFNDNLENLKGKVHKVQAAFGSIQSIENFKGLEILKFERTGSMVQLVARGRKDEIIEHINKMQPILLESIPPTLEELFIFELGGLGYDFTEILE